MEKCGEQHLKCGDVELEVSKSGFWSQVRTFGASCLGTVFSYMSNRKSKFVFLISSWNESLFQIWFMNWHE